MTEYVNAVRLIRPYLYNGVYNQSYFKDYINNIKISIPEISNTILEYYPFSVYLYYWKSDETTKKIVDHFESVLKDILATNRPLVNKLFDELYQDRSTTEEDRENFFQTIINNLNKVYSYNVIPQNDYVSMMNIVL